jgi:hypothetical protein
MNYKLIILIVSAIFFTGCKTLKPYERIYINDPQMQMGDTTPKNFENYVHSIREGAVPPGSSKSSEGCGCN